MNARQVIDPIVKYFPTKRHCAAGNRVLGSRSIRSVICNRLLILRWFSILHLIRLLSLSSTGSNRTTIIENDLMLFSLPKRFLLNLAWMILVVAPSASDDAYAVAPQNAAESSNILVDDFETSGAGVSVRWQSEFGIWESESGEAAIDPTHAKSGKSCLHLRGGERTAVTVKLTDPIPANHVLRFWAERWTSRSPFSFRVEKEVAGAWVEIFNGDASVRVGRAFLNDVKIPLGDGPIERLRFSCSSPPATGILIDEMQITKLQPQKVTLIEQIPFTLPALIGKQSAPLAKLKITTEGNLQPLQLKTVVAQVVASQGESPVNGLFLSDQPGGPLPQGLSASRLLVGDNPAASRAADDGSPNNQAITDQEGTQQTIKLSAELPLSEGENLFWVNGFLDSGLSLDTYVGAKLLSVSCGDSDVQHPVDGSLVESASDAEAKKVVKSPLLQRPGIALREGGDDGVHTFRIPGLVTTKQGTLIAVYDIRHRGGGDLPNDIDIGMSRSTDGGRNWEPMRAIMDMGRDAKWRFDGIGDPAILVDQQTGTIWVAATWSHGNRSWVGSGPGMTPEETGQVMMVRSDDDGVTWSKPINVTQQIKDPRWCFVLPGPGRGITMSDGTIVFAAQYQDPPEKQRLPHSTILYSKDHGTTWQIGTGAWDDTTESQVVEIEPGVLMLNCRYNRKDRRVVMITRDMGKTWEKHVTSERSLIEPRACMASLIRPFSIDDPSQKNWLLFSNPDSTTRRERLMIKASVDLGLNWLAENRVLLDEGVSAGYSCMSMVDDLHVGILYEGSQSHLTFQRVAIEELFADVADAVASERVQNGSSLSASSDRASLELARWFTDHMVLQADRPLPIWGKAKPHQQVTVKFLEVSQSTTANHQGDWQVMLPPQKVDSQSHTLRVTSANESLEIHDVMLGEVWLCAGQSNMQWPLEKTTHAAESLQSADQPHVRLLNLVAQAGGGSGTYSADQLTSLTPDHYYQGRWERSTAEEATDFSAVGWHFGMRLREQLSRPIGLIAMAVGGSPTESWISESALAHDEELQSLVTGVWLDKPVLGDFCRSRGEQNLIGAMASGDRIPFDQNGPRHPFKPGFLWDAGVRPLVPLALSGVIWYQGESNAETAFRVEQHERLFPLLVQQWRDAWQQALGATLGADAVKLPFYLVQLPAIQREEWPAFRESQRRLANQIDDAWMAVTIDTGHPTNVHPPLKKPVGQRLADLALANTYERVAHADSTGPTVQTIATAESIVTVTFDHFGEQLIGTDDQPPRHFQLADDSGQFHDAKAKIVGKQQVAVWSDRVPHPRAVRYAWQPFPEPSVNLFNDRGYPASPFEIELGRIELSRNDSGGNTGTEK